MDHFVSARPGEGAGRSRVPQCPRGRAGNRVAPARQSAFPGALGSSAQRASPRPRAGRPGISVVLSPFGIREEVPCSLWETTFQPYGSHRRLNSGRVIWRGPPVSCGGERTCVVRSARAIRDVLAGGSVAREGADAGPHGGSGSLLHPAVSLSQLGWVGSVIMSIFPLRKLRLKVAIGHMVYQPGVS